MTYKVYQENRRGENNGNLNHDHTTQEILQCLKEIKSSICNISSTSNTSVRTSLAKDCSNECDVAAPNRWRLNRTRINTNRRTPYDQQQFKPLPVRTIKSEESMRSYVNERCTNLGHHSRSRNTCSEIDDNHVRCRSAPTSLTALLPSLSLKDYTSIIQFVFVICTRF